MVESEGLWGIALGVAGIAIGIVLFKLMKGRKDLPFPFPTTGAFLIGMGLVAIGSGIFIEGQTDAMGKPLPFKKLKEGRKYQVVSKASENLTIIKDVKSGDVRITEGAPSLAAGTIFTLNEKKRLWRNLSKGVAGSFLTRK